MGLLKIPTYCYFGEQQFLLDCAVYSDDYLYNKLAEMPRGWNTLYSVSDASAANAINLINNWFNANILNANMPVTIGLRGDEPSDYTDIIDVYNRIANIYPRLISPSNHSLTINRAVAVNNSPINNLNVGYFTVNQGITTNATAFIGLLDNTQCSVSMPTGLSDRGNLRITIPFLPENPFSAEGGINTEYVDEKGGVLTVDINLYFHYSSMSVYAFTIEGVNHTAASTFNRYFSDFIITGSVPDDDDIENPYAVNPSGPDGGDGTLNPSNLDDIDPAEIPGLPSVNICDLGLITIYNPTAAQLKSFSDFLWSNLFDLNTYKKLFGNVMEGIIGLSIVPVSPSIGGSKNVKVGNIDSGIGMSYLSSNWVQLDCGSVSIEKFVGCFMDADPYTKISIYLPFIGIRTLSADDINGGSIHVVYNIDVLTGACACFIEHETRGVLYTYNGSCITNVPLTSQNFSGAIQNAVSAVISGIGVAAGMATGAAPVSAMGAMGLLNSAANTAMNSKPQIQRSGNLGGSAGILSIMNPYVIIERPNLSVPNNIEKHVGQTSNITYQLAALTGFTMCEYVHIENCAATSDEISEMESLLKQGVYL